MASICRIDTFLSSDQNRCASKLLSAYAEADIEEIKRVAQSSTISNLDHVVISYFKFLLPNHAIYGLISIMKKVTAIKGAYMMSALYIFRDLHGKTYVWIAICNPLLTA